LAFVSAGGEAGSGLMGGVGMAETGWSGVEKALANSGHSSEIATAGWL
jgi:hypothetical protein